MRIIAIYDNGGKTLDRYTIVTDHKDRAGNFDMLGLSDNPGDYNGFSQWSTIQKPFNVMGRLGRSIDFTALSAGVQTHIAHRLFEVEVMA